ncbi:MAG TPA: hypothetical protein VI336_04140, partial [Candidatus Saccharimonadales bacterium]|nr:hypothetical protein [Candidatus Saccharimonadales bacterium]
VAAGADVSGNDYAHHGIGGVTLTPEQVAQNLDYSKQSQLAEYQQKSFFARILDTESPYSPASKLALAMPSNTTAALNNINGAFATFIKNPFGKLFNSFASIFTLHTNAAGFIPGKDPFGITQYGYPLDDPVFNQDPDQYWQTYCTTEEGKYNLTKDWNEYAAKNLNEDNFEPENLQTNFFASKVPGNKYGTNGCLLIQAAVGSAGAIFTDDVLSAEELASLSSSSGGGGSGGACDLGTDFSPSQPDKFAEAIAQYAPGLSRPECVEQNPQIKEFCSKAVPNDCKRQYFRAYALVNPDGNAACDGKDLADAGGSKYPGRKCIGVKYGDPPVGSNTIAVPVD